MLSQPYEEVICYKGAHIYKYEGGGVAGTSGLSFRLVDGDRGRISLDEVKANINPDDIHFPKTSVIALENTVNKGGGSYYSLEDIADIASFSRSNGLKMHLDGARFFNALVETKDNASDYGRFFDTISICLSKGLGAPVGSLLVGKREYINAARRVRKFMGGGMRQAGYLAAAGIYALENNIDRLIHDHTRARVLGDILIQRPWVSKVHPVETNIVIIKLSTGYTVNEMLDLMQKKGIQAVPFGADEIRLVTHLDFDDYQLDQGVEIIKSIK